MDIIHKLETIYGGRLLSIETGKLAGQANGAVTIRYGDTVLLATVTASREPKTDTDFFPLTVDYEEKLYAAGKIPGGFFKREGRPSEGAILTARLTDRPIRPLFPKGFRNEVQVVTTVLSADQENEPDILSIVGASAALTVSDVPFEGPVGAARVGYIDGQFVLNPTVSQIPNSALDLTIAGTEDAVVMVEAGCKEAPESLVLEALAFGQSALQEIVKLQKRLRDVAGKPKFAYTPVLVPGDAEQEIAAAAGPRVADFIFRADKTDREQARDALKKDLVAQFAGKYTEKTILEVIEELEKSVVRESILDKGLRPDGRDAVTIRPISCEVGVLPRTHGSGLFTRGQTQVMTIATLGSIGDEQIIDGLGLEESKRYMHHYNFPPFSTGEVRRVSGPSRRSIGHGALGERALEPVIPASDQFPYTIRLVSEVLSSNGSTSMASVCGSTLSLMDAGVPIKAPVAGIAMGLVTGEDSRYAILTDIQGIEDHLGDMDFKVAGTEAGITALQMDIKVRGLAQEILAKALEQARQARLFILGRMLATIQASRPELSPYAPRILRTNIPVEKIGTLIGPGGRTIRGIQEETGVKIDVEEDGGVFISSTDAAAAQKALQTVERLTRDIEVGGLYLGRVTRLTNFGAFVEILPGKDGLVRLGELAEYQVSRPEDVVSIGDEVMVKVIEIDGQGRVNLSRRAVIEGDTGRPAPAPEGRGELRRGPAPGGYRQGPPPGGPREERRGPRPPGRGPERGPGGPGGREPRPGRHW